MKKSVVVLIGLIYVTSIAVVSFFGLQFKVFDEIVSVERIEIIEEAGKTYHENETLGKYLILRPNSNGEYRYQISYRVYPDNATKTAVDFATDPNVTVKNFTVDDNGLVIIDKAGVMATVYIGATDGSGVETKITIITAE